MEVDYMEVSEVDYMEVSETLNNGSSKELINRTFRPRRPSSAAKTFSLACTIGIRYERIG